MFEPFIKFFKARARKKRKGFIFSSIIGAMASVLASSAMLWGTGGLIAMAGTAFGIVAAAAPIVFGGISLLKGLGKPKVHPTNSSPTYGSNTQQNQTNSQLSVPLAYGRVKIAGNSIWVGRAKGQKIKKIIAFSDGEINSINDIKFDDNDPARSDIIDKYYGNGTQLLTDIIDLEEGTETNAERAAILGGLENLAYIAIDVYKTEKRGFGTNVTAVIEGRKVRVYTDVINTIGTYTVVYSNNPAWVMFDLLTAYNGLGIGIKDDGTQDDALIASQIDIQSFIDAAAHCDESVSYYSYTTALTGNNNDLIWTSRQAGATGYTIAYINPGAPGAEASIEFSDTDILVNLATNGSSVITTTANDIISLVSNSDEVSALVKVNNADDNDGSGIVTALSQQSFAGNTGDKRYTFNMIFDSEFTVRDAIEEVKKNCNGSLVYKGEKLQFKIDKPETSVQVFTPDDIIQGSEEIWPLPKEEHYDILKIQYISPDHEWVKVQAHAERETFFNTPAISHSVDIFSIINYYQAARLAWMYLNRNVLCPTFGKFSTDMRAYDREIGDVITLSDNLMGYSSKLVKITSIIDDGSGVLDIYWREYNADLYNDELGCHEPELTKVVDNPINAAPGNVSALNAKVFLESVLFSWPAVDDPKAVFEIREGGSWDDSILIETNITGLSAATKLFGLGIKTYWIKAKSQYGVYSENAPSQQITITDTFLRNTVVNTDIINLGTPLAVVDCHSYNGKAKPDILPNEYWQDLSPEKWASSGERYYADDNNRWTYDCVTSSYFESAEIDLGNDISSDWYLNYDFYNGGDVQNTVKFYWKYKTAAGAYQDDWIEFSPGKAECRYAKFKIVFSNPNNVLSVLQSCYAIADVPDRLEYYNDITVPAGGVTIAFASHEQSKIAKPFTAIPAVVVTPEDNSKTLSPVWTNRTKDSVTIYLYDKADTKVSGVVDITVKGY
jgi:hypothetical protein